MSDTGGSFLVYVQSMGRAWPQWWPELYFGERGDRRTAVVDIVALDKAESELPLDELVLRHPLNLRGGDDE